MNIRAMFIDMDGTLLKTSNEISKRNREAIQMLKNQGVKVFLATGRQYEITVPHHRSLGLLTPLICLNGAAIHDGLTGKLIQANTVKVDKDHFHTITDGNTSNIIIHTVKGLYCSRISREVEEWIREGNVHPVYVGNLREADYCDVLKYSVRTGALQFPVTDLFSKEAEIIHWSDGYEVMAKNISKWSAIKILIRAYGIAKEEIVTIGDGPNDIQMIRHAGTGVAMGNASPIIKSAADFITTHHEQDGLAEFIERYLINNQNYQISDGF
ncbi:HAD family hydrolase [Evansella tamaricis]|uniref:HAD family hydrolase n=1 Tax=Evansella tamaricis TaxID=2069301 RepID=A0ABS6J9M9_9BACI|nr:HAD family hydrolase [Evansella tamaricis]MBU9710389.1 HAD family hydrolase [Evansella tamaricis]